MKYLVTYITSGNHYGNVSHIFQHDLPTEEEIGNLMKEISSNEHEGMPVCVLNLHPMHDENSQKDDPYAILIDGVKIKPRDRIEILDENGHCVYSVEFGQYKFQDVWHVGWYLKLDQFEKSYPEDKLTYICPVCYLDNDAVKEFKLIP